MLEIAFPNLIPALPEIFLAVAAMLLLMIGYFPGGTCRPNCRLWKAIVLIVAMVFVGLVAEGRVLLRRDRHGPFAVFVKVMTLSFRCGHILMSRSYLGLKLTDLSFPVSVAGGTWHAHDGFGE